MAKTFFAEKLFSEILPTTSIRRLGGFSFSLVLRFEPVAVSCTLGILLKKAVSAKKIFFPPDFKGDHRISEKSFLKYQEFLIFQKFAHAILDASQLDRIQA